jgi:uncharacterized protein
MFPGRHLGRFDQAGSSHPTARNYIRAIALPSTGAFGHRMASTEILLYVALGFVAQLVDGALGMAYGLLATSALLATGTPPVVASASVHAAEIVTTGFAGASHVWNRNIDWALLKRLAPAGVAGGVLGAYALVGLPETAVRIFVSVYLVGITAMLGRRILAAGKQRRTSAAQRERAVPTIPLGAAGGFFDAVGGGGWGPIVTSTLIARGDQPRHSIGSASLAEFFVTLAISVAFLTALDLTEYGLVVLGLVIGGALAAPLAGILSRVLPPRLLMIMVAVAVGTLAAYGLARLAIG